MLKGRPLFTILKHKRKVIYPSVLGTSSKLCKGQITKTSGGRENYTDDRANSQEIMSGWTKGTGRSGEYDVIWVVQQVPSINLIYLLSLTLDIRCAKLAGAISCFFSLFFLIGFLLFLVWGFRTTFLIFFTIGWVLLPVLYLSLLFSVCIRFYGECIRGFINYFL